MFIVQRTIEYAHFTHKLSGRQVDFFNTHLCLCNGDQLLGSAMTITDFMVQNRRPGSRIMLTGDFNCDDGYEQSKPVMCASHRNNVALDNCLFVQVFQGSVRQQPHPV